MDDAVEAERRRNRREYMREWLARDDGAGRKKATERRRAYIQKLKDGGEYEEFLAKRNVTEKRRYNIDPEYSRLKQRERGRKYTFSHWDRILYRNARARAVKKGLPFDLDYTDIIVPEMCPVLGIPIQKQENNLGPNSPSIDRIVPERGYVRKNVRVISQRANRLKCDGTAAEMLLVHQDLLRIEAAN